MRLARPLLHLHLEDTRDKRVSNEIPLTHSLIHSLTQFTHWLMVHHTNGIQVELDIGSCLTLSRRDTTRNIETSDNQTCFSCNNNIVPVDRDVCRILFPPNARRMQR
jgi:hypothetical protein